MAWIARKSFWFLLPDVTDIFIGGESSESFEALGKVIAYQEGVDMLWVRLLSLDA
jgi:hypothetical protein